MWKKTRYIALYFAAIFGFLELLLFNYLRKMRGYPQFSFWISITLAKICFYRIVINRAKILWY